MACIALAGAGGFLGYHLTRTHTSTLSVAPPLAADAGSTGGAAAPGSESQGAPGARAREIPASLPDFTLTDSSGRVRRLSDWKGRTLLVNFWATWCAPCRREIPLLKSLRHRHAAQGVEVVGIAVDFRAEVLKYARGMGIDYPVLIGEQDGLDAVAAFGMDTVFPFTVFADRLGRIVTLKVGELHEDEAGYILQRIDAVNAGRSALPEARRQIAQQIRDLAAQRLDSAPAAAGSGADPRNSAQEVP